MFCAKVEEAEHNNDDAVAMKEGQAKKTKENATLAQIKAKKGTNRQCSKKSKTELASMQNA